MKPDRSRRERRLGSMGSGPIEPSGVIERRFVGWLETTSRSPIAMIAVYADQSRAAERAITLLRV